MWLWKDKGGVSPLPIPLEYDKARAAGTLIAGSPETVRRELAAQIDRCGHNYQVVQIAFGSLTHAQEMGSLELFAEKVMPALRSPVARPKAASVA